jgi:DNA-directed RNA polymerase subunit RPC12/RpoP
MLRAINCPQCRHFGFIPNDMLQRSLVCSSCGTRAQFGGGEEIDAGRAALNLVLHRPQTACDRPENDRPEV